MIGWVTEQGNSFLDPKLSDETDDSSLVISEGTDAEETVVMNKTLRCQEAGEKATNKIQCWLSFGCTFPCGSAKDTKRCREACEINTM